jgi:hypothetical protein
MEANSLRTRMQSSLDWVYESINKELKELEKKEKAMEEAEKKAEENAAKLKDRVKLDIGGKIFSTTKQTLLRIPNSFFHALICSEKWKPDENGLCSIFFVVFFLFSRTHFPLFTLNERTGVFFIDRDPKHFDRILNFLRDGELDFTDLQDYGRNKLIKDLDFYQIPIPPQFKVSLLFLFFFCTRN